ncbi:hypothetical protein [Klebsiella sp. 2680]|nr:hypothetical protein [Klebsiella sp. 2680]
MDLVRGSAIVAELTRKAKKQAITPPNRERIKSHDGKTFLQAMTNGNLS